jgi:hypothetical protein
LRPGEHPLTLVGEAEKSLSAFDDQDAETLFELFDAG